MSEITDQYLSFARILVVAVYALFYGLGGMSGKWKRRFLGSAILMSGIIAFSILDRKFNWYLLFYYPLQIGATSVGYGADQLIKRIVKRIIQGLAFGFCPVALAITNQMYALWFLHIGICLSFCVILGVWNKAGSARKEETILGAVTGLLPQFMV